MTLPYTDYELKTTFWQDFSIADHFGTDAIRDTYNRAFEDWKHDVIYLTELVMVLNHKIWQWHERNETIARVYNSLWEQAAGYAESTLEGDDLMYYFMTTD